MPGAAHAGKMDCRRVKAAAGAIFRGRKRKTTNEPSELKIGDFTRAFPEKPKTARALLRSEGNPGLEPARARCLKS